MSTLDKDLPICEKRLDSIVILIIGCLVCCVISCISSAIQSAVDNKKGSIQGNMQSYAKQMFSKDIDIKKPSTFQKAFSNAEPVGNAVEGGGTQNNNKGTGTTYFTLLGCSINCMICIFVIYLLLRPKQTNCITK